MARARKGRPVTNAEAAQAIVMIHKINPLIASMTLAKELAALIDGLIRLRERTGRTAEIRRADRPARPRPRP